MDRIEAMTTFVRVVETGSFTKAAETLQISRTRATQQVQQLEAHLHIKLLNRTTRKVNVTTDGAAYYERVVRLLADLEDIESGVSYASAQPKGKLKVDVPSPLARIILMPALPAFHARYPELQIDMGVSDRTIDLIGESADCVIRGGDMVDQSLRGRHVGDLQLGLYAAPAYLSGKSALSDPRDLESSAHRIVGFLWGRTGKTYPIVLRRDGVTVAIEGRYVVAVDDGNAYLEAGVAGMGVLWLPEYMAKQYVADGKLQPLLQNWRLNPIPLHVAYPHNRYVSSRLRVFIDWVAELMAEHAPIDRSPSPRH
jgi:DNA-binding transcriptional LysR family regulator